MAAFDTSERLKEPIDSIEFLSIQSKIKYGTIKGGATENFFRVVEKMYMLLFLNYNLFHLIMKESKINIYERMWNVMNNNPDVFVNSAEEGFDKVKKGDFAYILGKYVLVVVVVL